MKHSCLLILVSLVSLPPAAAAAESIEPAEVAPRIKGGTTPKDGREGQPPASPPHITTPTRAHPHTGARVFVRVSVCVFARLRVCACVARRPPPQEGAANPK